MMSIIQNLAYTPRGRISEVENQCISPYLNLIGLIIFILCFWYTESSSVKAALYHNDEYNYKKLKRIKMSWYTTVIILFKCLFYDIKANIGESIGLGLIIILGSIGFWYTISVAIIGFIAFVIYDRRRNSKSSDKQCVENPSPNPSLKSEKWSIKSERLFTQEEIESVKKATVVYSKYGNSIMFTMVSGGQTYIPLVRDSNLKVGDSINMNAAKVLTLCKHGELDIVRIQA